MWMVEYARDRSIFWIISDAIESDSLSYVVLRAVLRLIAEPCHNTPNNCKEVLCKVEPDEVLRLTVDPHSTHC